MQTQKNVQFEPSKGTILTYYLPTEDIMLRMPRRHNWKPHSILTHIPCADKRSGLFIREKMTDEERKICILERRHRVLVGMLMDHKNAKTKNHPKNNDDWVKKIRAMLFHIKKELDRIQCNDKYGIGDFFDNVPEKESFSSQQQLIKQQELERVQQENVQLRLLLKQRKQEKQQLIERLQLRSAERYKC